jgi:hypothetical protein
MKVLKSLGLDKELRDRICTFPNTRSRWGRGEAAPLRKQCGFED